MSLQIFINLFSFSAPVAVIEGRDLQLGLVTPSDPSCVFLIITFVVQQPFKNTVGRGVWQLYEVTMGRGVWQLYEVTMGRGVWQLCEVTMGRGGGSSMR